MSYINKQTKIFKEGRDTEIVPIRSEARLKNYISSTDARAWCDIVEQRRQHILEYVAKHKESVCLDKMIPLEDIIKVLMVCKNAKMKQLEKKAEYLEKMVDIYSKLGLSPEQEKKCEEMMKKNNLYFND